MSEYTNIEVTTSVATITLDAKVSIDAPILKRRLISIVAGALKRGEELRLTRSEFLELIRDDIVTDGTYHLAQPEKPEWRTIPGGIDRLLWDTNSHWQKWFGEASDSPQVFVISLVLDATEITLAYASALKMGLIEISEDPPESATANRVLHYTIEACIEYGEKLPEVSDDERSIAERTVKRTLGDLFSDFTCGIGFSIERLEF